MEGSEETRTRAENNICNMKQTLQKSQKMETVALWMDLLNFREHLDNKNWNLDEKDTKLGMERIAAFHEVALLSAHKKHIVVQLNDAVVISKDLTENCDKTTELTQELPLKR
jgi:hypothetical protein